MNPRTYLLLCVLTLALALFMFVDALINQRSPELLLFAASFVLFALLGFLDREMYRSILLKSVGEALKARSPVRSTTSALLFIIACALFLAGLYVQIFA